MRLFFCCADPSWEYLLWLPTLALDCTSTTTLYRQLFEQQHFSNADFGKPGPTGPIGWTERVFHPWWFKMHRFLRCCSQRKKCFVSGFFLALCLEFLLPHADAPLTSSVSGLKKDGNWEIRDDRRWNASLFLSVWSLNSTLRQILEITDYKARTERFCLPRCFVDLP